jgi:hypothetical protein
MPRVFHLHTLGLLRRGQEEFAMALDVIGHSGNSKLRFIR